MENFRTFSSKTLNEQETSREQIVANIIKNIDKRSVIGMFKKVKGASDLNYLDGYFKNTLAGHLMRALSLGKGDIKKTQMAYKRQISEPEFLKNAAINTKEERAAILPFVNAAIKKVLKAEPTVSTTIKKTQKKDSVSPEKETSGKKESPKVKQQKLILTKILPRYNVNSAKQLNNMLNISGEEITDATIKATKDFQEKYNKAPGVDKITVDGLFGGQTMRAYKKFKKMKKTDGVKDKEDVAKATKALSSLPSTGG